MPFYPVAPGCHRGFDPDRAIVNAAQQWVDPRAMLGLVESVGASGGSLFGQMKVTEPHER